MHKGCSQHWLMPAVIDRRWDCSSAMVRWPRSLRSLLLGWPSLLVGQLVKGLSRPLLGQPCTPLPLAMLPLEFSRMDMLDVWWNPAYQLGKVPKDFPLRDTPVFIFILESKRDKWWWPKSASKWEIQPISLYQIRVFVNQLTPSETKKYIKIFMDGGDALI